MLKLFYKIYLPVIILLLLGYTAKVNWNDGQWQNVLEADAKGYYAYLPAVFVFHDLNFGFYQKAEVENATDPNLVYDYRVTYHGHTIDKYFVGEALLLAPFYETAHILTKLSSKHADGYSRYYVISITLAALFYLFLGLIALKKTMELYGFEKFTIFIVITVIVFGTNLFYYSIGEMGMSHVYSFSMVSLFMLYVTKYFRDYRLKYILYAALFFGLVVLIRPVNAMVILSVPFLAQRKENLIKGLKNYISHPGTMAASIFIVLMFISIQLVIYKLQTGSFFVYSYGEEGFNFKAPQIINFLFSYKKGLFIYTPVTFVSLFGFIYLWKDKYRFFTLLSFLFIIVYVLSSWWMWYYGGSFSSRVMVEYLPYFAMLLGFLYKGFVKQWQKIAFIGILFFLTTVNQVQTLQYRYYIIHWSAMNKERYWNVFMDIKPILNRKTQ